MEIDANLVERAKNGDSKAWNELYLATHQIAFGVAMQLVKNKDTAEDIMQDSYITAYTKLDTLKEQDKFQHWFNRIVANNCKNYLVKKKPDLFSQYSTYTEDGEELEFDVVDDRTEYQPDNALISEEIKQLFYDMLEKLPEEQRACALMFWVQDLSIAEIADILGVSQNTVKSRIHYAKKKMSAEAEDIKKRNESIFSITGFALIPFLRWLFKNDSSFAASPEKAEGILKICKSAGSMTKATGTAKAVAETVKTTAKVSGTAKSVATVGAGAVTKGIATKIVAGVLAAAIGIGGITLAVKNSNSNNVDEPTEQAVESTEAPTNDEIIIANSVADLGLNEEMVKAVTAIMSSEYVGFGSGDVIGYPEYTTNWFRTYWVYYYLTMNGLYDGNELKRNEEFQNKIVSEYGEYKDHLYPNKELCGIPDYDSFSKLYECLYGNSDVKNEYEKLKSYVVERQGFPIEYGLKPVDIALGLGDVEFILLDNGEYQVKYTVTTRHSTGDIEVPVENNSKYAYAYCSPQEEYEYTMSFKMDESSPLDIVITDSHWGEIDSYYVITYVTKDGKEETVTSREDFETIISPDYDFPTPEDNVEMSQKNESSTAKNESSTRKSNADLVEIDLFSMIGSIGIKTYDFSTINDGYPLVITPASDKSIINYSVCKVSWVGYQYNKASYTLEYINEDNQPITEQISIIFYPPKGSNYVNGEKIPATIKVGGNYKVIVDNENYKKYGFVFSNIETQVEVDYVYDVMKTNNISNKDFNTLKQEATSLAQQENGNVSYKCAFVTAAEKGYPSYLVFVYEDPSGNLYGYSYYNLYMNQYGSILDIDSQSPRNIKTHVLDSNITTVDEMKAEIRPSNGIVLDINK